MSVRAAPPPRPSPFPSSPRGPPNSAGLLGQRRRPDEAILVWGSFGCWKRLKPEANGSLSLPYPQQYKQKAVIGLAWRLGGLVVMEFPDGRVRETSRVNLQTDQELRASRRSCSRGRGCSRSSGVESYLRFRSPSLFFHLQNGVCSDSKCPR